LKFRQNLRSVNLNLHLSLIAMSHERESPKQPVKENVRRSRQIPKLLPEHKRRMRTRYHPQLG
jgi:hypothetical protein